jgi:hypothetical protein
MTDETKPPSNDVEGKPDTPPAPEPLPGQAPAPPPLPGTGDEYDRIADTIGFVPSRRKGDYVFQGIFVAIGLVIGLIVGGVGWGVGGLVLGGALGLLGAILLSGIVLMVKGWIRTAKGK